MESEFADAGPPQKKKVSPVVWIIIIAALCCCGIGGGGVFWAVQKSVGIAGEASPAVDGLFAAFNNGNVDGLFEVCVVEMQDSLTPADVHEMMAIVKEKHGNVTKGVTERTSMRKDASGSFMDLSIKFDGVLTDGRLAVSLMKRDDNWQITEFEFK